MALLHPSMDLDVNSNCFKETKDGYWKSKALPSYDFESDSLEISGAQVRAVAIRLEESLRAAKKVHLSCGEVLLPPDLLSRVATDIIRMAESEPCGLRGCHIILNFDSGSIPPVVTSNNDSDGGSNTVRKIGNIRWHAATVATFELHLTLKEDLAPWYSRLPQILRNLTKGGTIVVSPDYRIIKKKLYRSSH